MTRKVEMRNELAMIKTKCTAILPIALFSVFITSIVILNIYYLFI